MLGTCAYFDAPARRKKVAAQCATGDFAGATGATTNTPGAFGDHSYPIELYEAMACGRPVVASRTASTAWVLREHPERLVPPRDPSALADRLVRALDEGDVDYGSLPTWQDGSAALDAALRGAG